MMQQSVLVRYNWNYKLFIYLYNITSVQTEKIAITEQEVACKHTQLHVVCTLLLLLLQKTISTETSAIKFLK